jgi:transcriptional regulator with XRE-family HTH domain
MDLKVRRIRLKVTQEQVADRLVPRMSRSWVAKVERIEDDLPAKTVARIEASLRTFENVSEVA